MDYHIRDYYRRSQDESPQGYFHEVIPLEGKKGISFDNAREKLPSLTKGWYELSALNPKDRIDFTKEFWLSKLPFHPHQEESLNKFFETVDEINVFLVQPKIDEPYEVHMVYSLKKGEGFFRGLSPAEEGDIAALKAAFPNVNFPEDYLAFLQIHNGFSKTTDTGITRSQDLPRLKKSFLDLILQKESVLTSGAKPVDPETLVPFYESFGMPYFQCFWTEWYPENETGHEMGNVYYSGETNTISKLAQKATSTETMAFKTFIDWFMFYLESIE